MDSKAYHMKQFKSTKLEAQSPVRVGCCGEGDNVGLACIAETKLGAGGSM